MQLQLHFSSINRTLRYERFAQDTTGGCGVLIFGQFDAPTFTKRLKPTKLSAVHLEMICTVQQGTSCVTSSLGVGGSLLTHFYYHYKQTSSVASRSLANLSRVLIRSVYLCVCLFDDKRVTYWSNIVPILRNIRVHR